MSGRSKRLRDGRDDISCLNYLIIKIDAGKKLSTFKSFRLLSSFLLNSFKFVMILRKSISSFINRKLHSTRGDIRR